MKEYWIDDILNDEEGCNSEYIYLRILHLKIYIIITSIQIFIFQIVYVLFFYSSIFSVCQN